MRLVSCLLVLVALALPAAAQDAASDLGQTERDRSFLTRLIEDNLSGAGRQVEIFGFAGALSSRARFDRLTIADDQGIWLTIEDASLSWSRAALLRGTLDVEELTAARIALDRIPASQPQEKSLSDIKLPSLTARDFALPDLPVTVHLGRIGADRLELGPAVAGEAVTARFSGSADLDGGAGKAHVDLTRTDGPTAHITIAAEFSNETRFLSLDLDAAEAANGVVGKLLGLPGAPALHFTVKAAAPLSDWRADIALATDDTPRFGGTVTLNDRGDSGQGFGVDLSGDLGPLVKPEYQPFFGDSTQLQISGASNADGSLSLDALHVETGEFSLDGEAAIAATGLPDRFRLTGAVRSSAGGGVLLPFGDGGTRLAGGSLEAAYDTATGEAWTLTGNLTGLDTGTLRLGSATLSGAGTITRGQTGRAEGKMTLALGGLSTGDRALDSALTETPSAAFAFGWTPGQPFQLADLTLTAGPTTLTGAFDVSGTEQNLRVSGQGRLLAPELQRFAGLYGQALTGAADAKLNGFYEPLSGAFDLTLDAATTGLDAGADLPQRLFYGDTRITGGLARSVTGITARQLQIVSPRVNARLDGGFGTTDGTLTLSAALADLADVAPALTGPAELAGSLTRQQGRIGLTIDAEGPNGLRAGVTGRAAADWTSAQLAFRAAIADLAPLVPGISGPLDAQGSLDLAGQEITLDLAATAPLGTTLAVKGTAAQDLATAELDLDLGLADLASLVPQLPGAAALKGSLTKADDRLTYDLAAAAPTGITAGLTGTASADLAEIAAAIEAQIPSLKPFVARLDAPVTATGRIGRTADGLTLDLTGTAPEGARYAVSGTVAPDLATARLDLTGAIPLALAQAFAPGIALDGTADLDLHLDGAPGLDALTGTVTTTDAAVDTGTLALNAIAATVTLDPALRQRQSATAAARIALASATLDAKGASWGNLVTGPVTGEATAILLPDALRLDPFHLANGDATLSGTAALGLGADRTATAEVTATTGLDRFAALAGFPLSGTAAAAARVTYDLATAALAASVTGTTTAVAAGGPPALDLIEGDGSFAADLSLAGGTLTLASATLKTPALALDARSQGADGTIALDARLDNLGRLVPQLPGPLTASGTVRPEAQGARIDVTATGPGGATLAGRGSLSAAASDLSLTGTAPLGLANAFIGTAADIQGDTRFDLALNGAPSLSALSGEVRISGGRASIPAAGMELEDIAATARLAGGSASIDATTRLNDGGRLAAQGSIGLAAPFQTALDLDLTRVRYTLPPTLRTRFGGRLNLAGPLLGGATLSGRIDAEETEINLAFGTGGATLTQVRHAGAPPAVRATLSRAGLDATPAANSGTPFRLGLDVTVRAPNRIFVRGRGLDAELGGQLRVTGDTANVVPIGAFELVRGRLDLLGRRIALSEGQLLLQGSLDPTVRLVAATTADDIDIRIVTEGQVSEPRITLSSTPDLPQDEVLAHLLFGKDIGSISPLQAFQLAAAIRTLLDGGEGFSGKARSRLGLDDLDVSTDETGNVALKAGRYISDKVYADVSVNAKGETQLELNLDIKKDLKAKGSVGSTGETGIGIFFERDY